ncbi:hypothetical protein [Ktedonospora formicarum]|uniref:Uncharacterized protein n=1 Tax=Ktedonospora formicarum TaxID=2778364 RepID=A0A8J3I8F6_9CHLR|nr:hypothetical protein [Ktedonospora formicarum]GHO46599.1 hypothetical protein KSX_47620 [Ktedonospora formicarum]
MNGKERFVAFLQQPSTLQELREGQEIFRAKEIQDYLYFVRDPDTALREMAPLLNTIDGFHAGALALLCGSRVENGGDVSIPLDATLTLMIRQLEQAFSYQKVCRELSDEELIQHFPEATQAHYGLPYTLLAAMTMLSRDVQARQQLQQRQDVRKLINELEELSSDYETLYYIKEALALLDNKELLVLDPTNERGFLTRLVGVQDRMYHCYALLQHAILEHTGPGYLNADPTVPDAVRYAQNRDLTRDDYQSLKDIHDYQRFSFCYPAVSRSEDGHYSFEPLGFFPGSASFYDNPAVALYDPPVILIGEKFMTFNWTPSNMYPVLHSALNSSVEIIRELSSEEVQNWLQKLSQRNKSPH